MKKLLLSLCAALCLGLGFSACSSDSDSGSGSDPKPNAANDYLFEQGYVSNDVRDTAYAMQGTTFDDIKAIRNYLFSNTSLEYYSKSVSENEIYALLQAAGLQSAQATTEVNKLKSRGNYLTFYPATGGYVWFYAEKKNSSAGSGTSQKIDLQLTLSGDKKLDDTSWGKSCTVSSSQLAGISQTSVLKISVKKITGAGYSKLRICPKGQWESLGMVKVEFEAADSAEVTEATDDAGSKGKEVTLKADSATVLYTLSYSDCTKISNAEGIEFHGYGLEIVSASLSK